MSSLRHPVGPQPPQVYWRRRALVIGVLLAIVLVVVLIVARPGSGDEGEGAAATPTPTEAPAAEAPAATAPAADATEAPDATAASGDAPACAPGQIVLTPVTDKTNYGSTELPQISMSIQNSGRADCAIDLGSAQQRLTITSGDDTYWTSSDCQQNGTNQVVVVPAGETLSTPPISWSRERSSPDTCDAVARDAVPSGGASYFLSVSVGDVESAEPKQMILN